MAQEGVAAALTLSDDIIQKLQTAQTAIEGMDKAAAGLEKTFGTISTQVTGLANGLKGTGIAFESAFNKDGTLKTLRIIAEAIDDTAKTTENAAKKSANEFKKAYKNAVEIASSKKVATSLSERVEEAISGGGKDMESMKTQIREMTRLQTELNRESKRNAFLDPSLTSKLGVALDSAKLKLRSIRDELSATSKNAQMVQSMLAQAFSPILIQRFLQQMVTVRGEFEMAQKSLAVIIHSESQAQEMFNQITKMAIRSPFSVSSILQQTKQLAAYRIETDKLIETTKMLGDISAGVGADMQRLILAYGQVKAAEFLKGTELRQFSEAGVNMLGGLADRFTEIYNRTVSVGEVMQMVSKRMVKFKDVEAVLKSVTEAGGAFYKMQEQQADTLRGKIVNLGDRIQIAFNEMGKSYDAFMKGIITGLENIISHWEIISTTIIPLLSGKLISGVVGIAMRSLQNIEGTFAKITKQITLMNMATIVSGKNLNVITKGAHAIAGAIKGIGLPGVLQIVATIATLVWQIVQNARRLEKTVKNIAADATASTDQMVLRFEKLLDVASDVEELDKNRLKAIEAIKSEYGNILKVQDLELDNIQKLNDARQESIQLIRLQAQEEARVKAMNEVISDLQKRDEKRGKAVWESASYLSNIMEQNGIGGWKLLSKEDSEAARKEVEHAIEMGIVEGGDKAKKLFLEKMLKMAGATEEQISKILSEIPNNLGVGIEDSFWKVADAMKPVANMFGDTIDTSIAKSVRVYKESIKELEKVRNEFDFNKQEYEHNPQQGQIDFRAELEKKRQEIEDQIKQAFVRGEFSESVMNGLLDDLKKKFKSEAGIGNNVDELILTIQRDLNKKFPKLRIPIGSGILSKEDEESVESHAEHIRKALADMEKDIDDWNRYAKKGIELPRVIDLENQYGSLDELRTEIKAIKEYLNKLDGNSSTKKPTKGDLQSKWSSFISALKSARKEMDKLNEEGTGKYIEKLRALGKQVGVTLDKTFSGTNEEIMALIDKYKNKLSSVERIDVELSLITDAAEDQLEEFKNKVSDLWDQYDTSKKLEQWNLVPEVSSFDVLQQLKDIEDKLRESTADGDRKLADDISKRRIQIARQEQEEVAKIMYEAQKKSLSKVDQAYKDMYEKLGRIRTWEKADERDAAINDQVAKSMREIADAEWDAYRATEEYAMAFGNLEGLSEGVLKSLRESLQAWLDLPEGALQPSEIKTVMNAMQKIDEKLQTKKISSYFDAIRAGFRSVSDAKKAFNDMQALQEQLDPLLEKQKKLKEQKDFWTSASGYLDTESSKKMAESLSQEYDDLTDKINKLIALLDIARGKYKALLDGAAKYVDDANQAFNTLKGFMDQTISLAKNVGEAIGEAFGDDTNAAIEGFQEGFNLVAGALGLVSSLMVSAKLAAMSLDVYLKSLLTTMWPLLAAAAVIGTILAIFRARDVALQKQVEKHKDTVERLEKAYERLEKAMDAALNVSKLRTKYAEMNANLEKQRQELQEAIAANNQRKQTDEVKNETKELTEQLEELGDQVDDLKDKFYEALGVATDSRSVASDWASDWLSAFKETGKGLDALRDDFDDLYDNLVVGQLWSQIMGPRIEELQGMVRDALANGDLSDAEAAAIRAFKNTLAVTNAELEAKAKELGIRSGVFNENTLQRGVETVTEQTATALESILNRVSYDVSDTNAKMANIEIALTGEGENTILTQLKSQTRYLADIARIASAVYYAGGHPKGAGALKVITEMA